MSALITIFLLFFTCTIAVANDYCEKCEIAKGTIAPGEKAYIINGIPMDRDQAYSEICSIFGLSQEEKAFPGAPGFYGFEYYLTKIIGNDFVRKNPANKQKFIDFWNKEAKNINCSDYGIAAEICPMTGGNPIFCSANTFSYGALKLLIKYGISGDLLNVPSSVDGRTVLDFIEKRCKMVTEDEIENSYNAKNCKKVIELFIENGAKRSAELTGKK